MTVTSISFYFSTEEKKHAHTHTYTGEAISLPYITLNIIKKNIKKVTNKNKIKIKWNRNRKVQFLSVAVTTNCGVSLMRFDDALNVQT